MSTNILQAEESIQNALELLRSMPESRLISEALSLLAPRGYRPVVELQQNGRKKRRTASIENWSPENGEILISFSKEERANEPAHARQGAASPRRAARLESPPTAAQHSPAGTGEATSPEQQLCEALEEVERQGRSFVALKWFRDDVLPSKAFAWASNPEQRQAVLARAVESGAVLTSKIPNPRSPFPTTTIRLNRSRMAADQGGRRFSPVRIPGEPLSATILRDRGVR